MKKILSLLLISIILIAALSFTSCANEGIFVYELNDEGDGYIISSWIRNPIIVFDGRIILDTYNGLPVTEIKSGGFSGWENLYDIYIPGNVEKIGSYAFGSSSLIYAEIGEGTEYIGDYAFAYTALYEIKLPSTVEYIGAGAFALCTNLNSIQYNGTMADWEAIEKGENWNQEMGSPDIVSVNCTDGVVTFYGEFD